MRKFVCTSASQSGFDVFDIELCTPYPAAQDVQSQEFEKDVEIYSNSGLGSHAEKIFTVNDEKPPSPAFSESKLIFFINIQKHFHHCMSKIGP